MKPLTLDDARRKLMEVEKLPSEGYEEYAIRYNTIVDIVNGFIKQTTNDELYLYSKMSVIKSYKI